MNELVKPRFFSGFPGKNIMLCILTGISPFKMHKIIFFQKKKTNKKRHVRLPCLKFSVPLPETPLLFVWPNSRKYNSRKNSELTVFSIYIWKQSAVKVIFLPWLSLTACTWRYSTSFSEWIILRTGV